MDRTVKMAGGVPGALGAAAAGSAGTAPRGGRGGAKAGSRGVKVAGVTAGKRKDATEGIAEAIPCVKVVIITQMAVWQA